jgi:hypothetical protein
VTVFDSLLAQKSGFRHIYPPHTRSREMESCQYSQAQPGHCFTPAHTILKAMSKSIPQICVSKFDALIIDAFHLDGVEVIGRDNKLWSPTRAIVVERYREENLGHVDSLDFEFCSIIRDEVEDEVEGGRWEVALRGRHDCVEIRYLICSTMLRSLVGGEASYYGMTSVDSGFPSLRSGGCRSFQDRTGAGSRRGTRCSQSPVPC